MGSIWRLIDNDVIIQEYRIETQCFRLHRRRDDGLGRRLKPEIIRVGANGTKTERS